MIKCSVSTIDRQAATLRCRNCWSRHDPAKYINIASASPPFRRGGGLFSHCWQQRLGKIWVWQSSTELKRFDWFLQNRDAWFARLMRFRSSNLRGITKDSCTLMLSLFLLTNWSMNIKRLFILMVLVQLVPKSFKESVRCVCLSWRRLSILGTALGSSKEQTHYPHFLWFYVFLFCIFLYSIAYFEY